jgi:hypothetical protein
MRTSTKHSILIWGLLIFVFSGSAYAIDLRGYFPLYNGRFWNFKGSQDGHSTTWAVNGALTLKEVGRVTLMATDNGKFLCLREDWEGIRIYGEYGADGYRIPEKPVLFLPSVLTPDKPIEESVSFKVFSDPDGNINFKESGKINQKIKFVNKEFEDVTISGKVFKNCAVIEKMTTEPNNSTTETLYLAPGIGPIKRVLTKGNETVVYLVSSYADSGTLTAAHIPIKELLPFKPGITWTYKDQQGTIWRTTTKGKESFEGITSLPFAEDTGDIYYYSLNNQGLVLNQKFWSLVGGCTDFHPPDSPLLVLPATLKLGEYHSSITNACVHTWPSMTLMEEFYPEMHCSTIAVLKENVTVPAGNYRDCLKICLFSVSRNFNMNNEQLRIGYIWLAKNAGVVKKQLVDMTNYFNPQRINRVTSVKFWDLIKIEKKGS